MTLHGTTQAPTVGGGRVVGATWMRNAQRLRLQIPAGHASRLHPIVRPQHGSMIWFLFFLASFVLFTASAVSSICGGCLDSPMRMLRASSSSSSASVGDAKSTAGRPVPHQPPLRPKPQDDGHGAAAALSGNPLVDQHDSAAVSDVTRAGTDVSVNTTAAELARPPQGQPPVPSSAPLPQPSSSHQPSSPDRGSSTDAAGAHVNDAVLPAAAVPSASAAGSAAGPNSDLLPLVTSARDTQDDDGSSGSMHSSSARAGDGADTETDGPRRARLIYDDFVADLPLHYSRLRSERGVDGQPLDEGQIRRRLNTTARILASLQIKAASMEQLPILSPAVARAANRIAKRTQNAASDGPASTAISGAAASAASGSGGAEDGEAHIGDDGDLDAQAWELTEPLHQTDPTTHLETAIPPEQGVRLSPGIVDDATVEAKIRWWKGCVGYSRSLQDWRPKMMTPPNSNAESASGLHSASASASASSFAPPESPSGTAAAGSPSTPRPEQVPYYLLRKHAFTMHAHFRNDYWDNGVVDGVDTGFHDGPWIEEYWRYTLGRPMQRRITLAEYHFAIDHGYFSEHVKLLRPSVPEAVIKKEQLPANVRRSYDQLYQALFDAEMAGHPRPIAALTRARMVAEAAWEASMRPSGVGADAASLVSSSASTSPFSQYRDRPVFSQVEIDAALPLILIEEPFDFDLFYPFVPLFVPWDRLTMGAAAGNAGDTTTTDTSPAGTGVRMLTDRGRRNYNAAATLLSKCEEFLSVNVRGGTQYITVVQRAEGIAVREFPRLAHVMLQVLQVNAGGGGDVPIPLLAKELHAPPPPQQLQQQQQHDDSHSTARDPRHPATPGAHTAGVAGVDEPEDLRYGLSFFGSVRDGLRQRIVERAAVHPALQVRPRLQSKPKVVGETGPSEGPSGTSAVAAAAPAGLESSTAAATASASVNDDANNPVLPGLGRRWFPAADVASASAAGGVRAGGDRRPLQAEWFTSQHFPPPPPVDSSLSSQAPAAIAAAAASSGGGKDDWIEGMQHSMLQLAPSGTNPSSFRFYESLQLGLIPVYVYDTARPWLPYHDQLDLRSVQPQQRALLESIAGLASMQRSGATAEIDWTDSALVDRALHHSVPSADAASRSSPSAAASGASADADIQSSDFHVSMWDRLAFIVHEHDFPAFLDAIPYLALDVSNGSWHARLRESIRAARDHYFTYAGVMKQIHRLVRDPWGADLKCSMPARDRLVFF